MASPLNIWKSVFSASRNSRRDLSFNLCVGRYRIHTKSNIVHRSKYQHSRTRFRAFYRYLVPVALVGAGSGFVLGQYLKNEMWRVGECQAKPNSEPPTKHLGGKKKPSSLDEAIEQCRDKLQRIKDESGAPGIVIAVTVDGELVWSQGLGYSDVENRVKCHAGTVLRIASVSKSITSVIAGKLLEENKLDLDKSIREYIKPDIWPDKTYKGDQVTITCRQLMAHLGGVRHYSKDCKKTKNNEKGKCDTKDDIETSSSSQKGKKTGSSDIVKPGMEKKEYYIKDNYKSVTDALKMFKEDELCAKPGSQYRYTTHGYTLVSAVIEGASGKKFPVLMRALFKELGMNQTYLDENEPLIYNRSRYYIKSTKGKLINAPYVDCSYKWAGGGLLSTVGDLVRFGNVMLYSYQFDPSSKGTPGYLRRETVDQLWSPALRAKCDWDSDGGYGLGWGVVKEGPKHGGCPSRRFYISHTGGAIGASSALVLLPKETSGSGSIKPPEGVVVAIIANMQSVGMNKVALEIAKSFEGLGQVH